MAKATGNTGLMIAPRERPRKTLVLLSLNGEKTQSKAARGQNVETSESALGRTAYHAKQEKAWAWHAEPKL